MLRIAKVINKASYDNGHIIKEASLIKNLKHPHIPIVYDIYEDDISICIIEEYISGKSLRKFVYESEKLSVNQICDIGIKLCNILEYLHNYCGGIIHGDIKPDNIIIDDNNNVKLIDFGNSLYSCEKPEQSMISPVFAAPEQYQDRCATVSMDIYSVGMVLKFMTDYSSQNSNAKAQDICEYKSDLKITGHNKLYPIIRKCTRHKPESRYTDIRAVRVELQKVNRQSLRGLNKKKDSDNHSYVIKVSGTKRGIGVTHIVLSMAYILNEYGIRCIIAEKSGRSDIQDIMLNGKLDKKGIFTFKGVSFAADNVSYKSQYGSILSDFKVIIVDEGLHGTNKVNYEEIMCSEDIICSHIYKNYKNINIIVAGGKYGIVNECSIINKSMPAARLVLNLLSGTQYYEYANYIANDRVCYRMPCVYSWYERNEEFVLVMKDFIQDNMPEIWENIITDLKKEKLDLLYEKIYIIRHKIFKILQKITGNVRTGFKKK